MRSSSSSKQGGGRGSGGGITTHMRTLHQRLYHALHLGLLYNDEKGRKWHCTDIETQRLVIRSMDAFLDFVSTNGLQQHPLVKDSVIDMIRSLESILTFGIESTLLLASSVSLKIFSVLPTAMLQPYVADLLRPLSSLLSSMQSQVVVTSASALNLILSNLSTKQEEQVWNILNETEAVGNLIHNVKKFSSSNKTIDYIQEMAFLLSKLLWRWPSSRYCVWTDTILLNVLDTIKLKPENSLKVAVLKLYSAIALCGNGAQKLLEKDESLTQIVVHCMDSSFPPSVRMEGFKLAESLMISEEGRSRVLKTSSEALVKAIISGMSRGSPRSGKLTKEQMTLMLEACNLARITRWAGDHQIWFWKAGVDTVLLDLLLDNLHQAHELQNHTSARERILGVQEGLNANFLVSLRPYIWDILGWLAANCADDFDIKMHVNEVHFDILIRCACIAFLDSIRVARQQNRSIDTCGCESASRAVFMMVYSPCNAISSQVKFRLSEVLKSSGEDFVQYILDTIKAVSSNSRLGIPDNLQMVINLISLACYSSLPCYQEGLIRREAIKTTMDFIMWWLDNPSRFSRSSISPHLHDKSNLRTCCWPCEEDWEGEDMLLLFSLWCLAELMYYYCSVDSPQYKVDCWIARGEVQFVSALEGICINNFAAGPRWYAAYLLCYFGWYGIPSKFGRRVGKALNEKEYADTELILMNHESIFVHEVVLTVRCPSLLPSGTQDLEKKTYDSLTSDGSKRTATKIHLSAHVDHQSMLKLLQYVYMGHLEASGDLVKKLKTLAKHCNLQDLLQMLRQRNPKWGRPIPSLEFAAALAPPGCHCSDILLEPKVTELADWKCSICSNLTPHLHAHKVIVGSSCDYLRALFRSGMQESHLQTIKAPVGWNSLVKLVKWLYTGYLPKPLFGCLWDNLSIEEKLLEAEPYIELCWLAEFWQIDDFHEDCFGVVVSCLESSPDLSIKTMQLAADLSQWKLTQVAASYLAPMYHRLRNSGDLDMLDPDLIEMVRAASVRLSQRSAH